MLLALISSTRLLQEHFYNSLAEMVTLDDAASDMEKHVLHYSLIFLFL